MSSNSMAKLHSWAVFLVYFHLVDDYVIDLFNIQIALDTLSDHLDAIYDLTIAYRDKNEDLLPRKKAKSLPGK